MATALPVEFVAQQDPREKTKDFARIRIVPIGATGQENRFKVMNYDPLLESENFLYNLEKMFIGAVPFTPESKTSVEGYLLPRKDNSIGVAVCKIVSSLDERVVRTLVRECLIRSLGFASMSQLRKDALIGNWNSFNEDSSKLLSLDGERALWTSPFGVEQKRKFETFYKLPSAPEGFEVLNISSYERLMISALYCSEIVAGMDKMSAIKILKSRNCLDIKNR